MWILEFTQKSDFNDMWPDVFVEEKKKEKKKKKKKKKRRFLWIPILYSSFINL